MARGLGKKAINAAGWKFAERILAQGISTVVGIVLARILDPEHYGVIAIVNVFITFCNVFVVTGLPEALIQKKDADETDFSSVFYLNLGIAIILYVILSLCAPFIADFYGEGYEQLVPVIRIMGIRLIFGAINSIQHARIARDLAFKKYFFVTLTGTLISAVVGISMAYLGFGVYALVAQYMTNTTIDTIMLFVFVRWHPKKAFSIKCVKRLGGYGIRLLIVSLVTTIINELEQLFIGKAYTSEDLAFYSKGNTYPKLLVNNVSTAISSTIFPLISKVQDDKTKVRYYASRAIRLISYIIFPLVIGLMVVAEDFVRVLLTDKWLPCVPYLQIFCVCFALDPIIITNSQCLTAQGDSKTYARITISLRIIGVGILLLSLQFGVIGIVIGKLLKTVLEYIVKTFPTKKRLSYGLIEQCKDMAPSFLGCFIMIVMVRIAYYFTIESPRLIALILQVLIGGVTYLLFSLITKNKELKIIIDMIKNIFKRNANNG